ncbi:hypothetical protein B0H67DRAFT_665462 [Lasiosphaeris hirsuta]|uniref:Ankyrin repeat protein n=1 Tax=Lasiosphaeris hirsuta TaxID=260670 RepID=A0AA40AGF4_9PEZI|nr:hypothetical protein B0H67DRAFT_665462 [Lasiosphaeris hirsuta]
MDLFEVLMPKGARLDHTLLEAARSNNRELVTFLLDHGAPSAASPDQTALGCCIEEGVVDMDQFLHYAGLIDPGGSTHYTCNTCGAVFSDAIRKAIRNYDWDLIEQLMAHGDDIDFSKCPGDDTDRIILDDAVKYGSLELIGYLINRGAAFGRRTLRLAVEAGGETLDALPPIMPPAMGPNGIEPGPLLEWSDPNDPPAIVRAAQLKDPSTTSTIQSTLFTLSFVSKVNRG